MEDKPTLHHMNSSQSQRILWLLEELDIPGGYNLELHRRQGAEAGNQTDRAPPELAEIHALGKSPLLVTAPSSQGGRVIVESSAIIAYLIATYDTAGRFRCDDHAGGWIRDESLTSFTGSSLGPITTVYMLMEVITEQTPFLIRPLVRLLTGAVLSGFVNPELRKMYSYLESELANPKEGFLPPPPPPTESTTTTNTAPTPTAQHLPYPQQPTTSPSSSSSSSTENPYFSGPNPGRPDFMLSWPTDTVAQRSWIPPQEMQAKYPKLAAWRERCKARPAWKKALDKGNGYDLNGLGRPGKAK